MGESAGEPRHISDPSLFSESFSACVDFLGVKVNFVDKNKIGVIGICGSGGFALSAAQMDTRIKAVATASMYDMTFASRMGQSPEEIFETKKNISKQRWIDFENNSPEYIPMFGEEPLNEVPDDIPEPDAEWLRFYALKRGHHSNATGGFTTTSNLSMMNYNLLDYIGEISPRPILFIVGDRAHSRIFSEHAYENALEPKEFYEVKDAEHIDLYDKIERIPFDKLEEFFKEMN